MKKLGIVLFVIIAVVGLSLSSYGFGLNLKEQSCKAACDKTYKECMKKSKEDYEKSKNDTKKSAADLACKESKEKCYKKCK